MLWNVFSKVPQASQRLVRDSVLIARNIMRPSRHPEYLILSRIIDQQSVSSCFFEHPCEWNLRQTGFSFRVTAAHVAMDTREPDLLEIFRSPGLCQIGNPELSTEKRASFVDRDGMTSHFDIHVV